MKYLKLFENFLQPERKRLTDIYSSTMLIEAALDYIKSKLEKTFNVNIEIGNLDQYKSITISNEKFTIVIKDIDILNNTYITFMLDDEKYKMDVNSFPENIIEYVEYMNKHIKKAEN